MEKEINRPVTSRLLKPYFGTVNFDKGGYLQMDLADLSAYKTKNRGYSFILCMIDLHSRYVIAVPLKNKQANTVKEAFESVYKRFPFKIKKIYSDKGSEFLGSFAKLLKELDIKQIMTNSIIRHQVVIERFIRTLKEAIRQYFVKNNNFEWVGKLPLIIFNYNNKKHSRLGATPAEVMFGKKPVKAIKPTLRLVKDEIEVGDHVRIMVKKDLFDKKTLSNNYSVRTYEVKSYSGNMYTLDNGESYPRWMLLKSNFRNKDDDYEQEKKAIHRQKRIGFELKREGIQDKNVLVSKRVIRKNRKYVD